MRLLAIRRADELRIKGRATLVIKLGDKIVERGIRDIDAVLIIGSHVKIKSSVPPVLSSHNIPLAIIAKDNVAIIINPIGARYNNYRRLQYQLDKQHALDIALEYIKAKIKGMQNILKYHRKYIPEVQPPPKDIEDPIDYELNIRTWESSASHLLWANLVSLIRSDILSTLKKEYNFTGRKPRHPDPFNKTLSIMYAVIYSIATKALIAAGLDPTYGFLHRTKYSTPLTFDYAEMLKPIAIEATINLINKENLPELDSTGEITHEWVKKIIKIFYEYLTLIHKDTGKTPYQQMHIKAFCLAKYLEGKCRKDRLTITWNRALYRERKRVH